VVDTKYVEVVKTYGRWVNELGEVRSATLPFTLFETYRENVDGKYWFPNYARSDDVLHLKEVSVPVRLVIKWTEFKVLPAQERHLRHLRLHQLRLGHLHRPQLSFWARR